MKILELEIQYQKQAKRSYFFLSVITFSFKFVFKLKGMHVGGNYYGRLTATIYEIQCVLNSKW